MTAPGGSAAADKAAGRRRLARLWAEGCALLGSRHAIMAGAMSWVSERNFVSAVSNAGGFGVIACGSMGPDALGAEIDATRALTAAPFGVNLITMHPELDALIDVCARRAVSHVILAGGLPRAAAIRRIEDSGARVLCFAPALALARKLVRMGVDGLIVEGMEAGGHIGPVSTGVLAQEILPEVREVPIFVAGGLGRGEAIADYLELGAAGCQLGTRFVCARESIAHPAFKKAAIRAHARDNELDFRTENTLRRCDRHKDRFVHAERSQAGSRRLRQHADHGVDSPGERHRLAHDLACAGGAHRLRDGVADDAVLPMHIQIRDEASGAWEELA